MPIEVSTEVRPFAREEFHDLTHQILGITFEVHNRLGRLFHEEIYKQAIRQRAEAAGIVPAEREVRVTVVFGDFRKEYFIDLLLAKGLLIEVKTAESLTQAHEGQALHYLLLAGLQNGLLINMRTSSVKHRYVTTSLTPQERRRFEVHDSEWRPTTDRCHWLRDQFLAMIADWGLFLHVSLYREAIIHGLGPTRGIRKTPIIDGDLNLGWGDFCLLDEHSALAVTAVTDEAPMREHLCRLLRFTPLTNMQWINMNRHNITFQTLSN